MFPHACASSRDLMHALCTPDNTDEDVPMHAGTRFRYTRAQRRREMGVTRFSKLRKVFFEAHGVAEAEAALRDDDTAGRQHSLSPAVFLAYLRTRFRVDAAVRSVYEVM